MCDRMVTTTAMHVSPSETSNTLPGASFPSTQQSSAQRFPTTNLERFGSLNSFFIISRSPCNHEIPTTNLCYRRVGYGITSSRSTHSEKGSGGHDLVQLDNTIEKAPLESDHQSHSKRDLEKRKRKRKSKKAKKAKA
ncbi:hypothetical protein KEM48_007048 [Puccinia striiformis f. sp. tritici PST-130]|nr:hypothetical protein KEM48_007048 [Puccinia striiformis f. sp. tritici PST-130]